MEILINIKEIDENIVETEVDEYECSFVKLFKAEILVSNEESIIESNISYCNNLMFIKEGVLKLDLEGTQFILEKGDLIFIEPLQRVFIIADKKTRIYSIKFFFHTENGYMKNLFLDKRIDLSAHIIKKKGKNLKLIIDEIIRDNKKKDVNKEKIEALLLYAIKNLRKILVPKNEIDKSKKLKESKLKIINKTINYILDNIYDSISLKDIANKVNISEDYISHLFKEITGVSLMSFNTSCKIEEAKILLRETEFSINDISYSLKFYDASHFNRKFKKEAGITPGQYRKKYHVNIGK